MDAFQQKVRDTVHRQLRPMVRKLSDGYELNERALNSIEATARHLVALASDGALRLIRIERTEEAKRGLFVLTVERVSCQDNRP